MTPSPNPRARRQRPRRATPAATLAAALALAALAGPALAEGSPPNLPPSQGRTEGGSARQPPPAAPPTAGSGTSRLAPDADAPDYRVLHGLTRPGRMVTLAAPFDGVLMGVPVREGQRVEAGEPLALMDDRVARAAVAAARAAADAQADTVYARLELELAQMMLDRIAKSHAAQAASDRELAEARVRRDQAAASLASADEAQTIARHNLLLEEARLRQHTLRAPFAGRVVRRFAEPGSTVTTADPVVSLIDLTTLRAELNLPAELYAQLTPGQTYTLLAGPPVAGPVDAVLLTADPIIDPATRTFRCAFEIDNQDLHHPAGFAIRLTPTDLAQLQTTAADAAAQ